MNGFHLRVTLVVVAAFLVVLAAGCARKTTPGGGGQRGAAPPPVLCPVDGLPTTAAALDRRPIAVMIENHPSARPQSGLPDACLVYEGLTEGGITRFMAVYLHGSPAVIGPVRSARPHFIHTAEGWDAAYVHCGESYEALQLLQNVRIPNLDEMRYGKRAFWRDRSRRMPHNLYTSTEKLRAVMVKQGWEGARSSVPEFVGGAMPAGAQPGTEVRLSFAGGSHYRLRIVYDAEKGGYVRYMDGKLHTDRATGKPIVMKNVLLQVTPAEPFATSDKGTYDVNVMGVGGGFLLTGGQQTGIKWYKYNRHEPTKYTDSAGNPPPFQAGQTWIVLVPAPGAEVQFGPAKAAPQPTARRRR